MAAFTSTAYAADSHFYSPHPVPAGVAKDLSPGTTVQTPQGTFQKSLVPTNQAREKAFAAAQLEQEVKGWDELARDELFMRARRYPVGKLVKLYPAIEKAKLERLKNGIEHE